MAKIANTVVSTDSTVNREDLSDIVSMITPEDTPIYSSIRHPTCKGTNPNWGLDELEAPGENIHAEADEYNFSAINLPERVGNHTQIFRKTLIVSGTQDNTSEAGNATKTKRQIIKKGVAIRKDVEFSLLDNKPSLGGETRQSGSLSTWVETNVSRGAGGANGGYDAVTKLTVAPSDGAQRAFSKAIMDDVAQQGYNSGANFKKLVVSPHVKSVFVTFMSDSNVVPFRKSANGRSNTIIANADIYEGPFGKLTVVPNRVQSAAAKLARNAHFLDPEFVKFAWLKGRKIHRDRKVAKTGDANKSVIIGEGTLKVGNERGIGIAADLFGLTATT